VSVKIGGHQHGDGSVGGRVIHVDTGTGGAEMTLAEASQFCDDLRAAIDELDALAD
jgi:hypothetical protein